LWCGSLEYVIYAFMQGSISLTNQKQSVVSGREFAICCAHGLCSLTYCFSHCALDFPSTHPIVFPPCLRWHCLRWRRLLAGFLFSGCLPVLAGCLPAYLRLLAGPLGCLSAPPLAVCSISGYWPLPVRLLAGFSAACRCVYLCISIFNFVICSSACTFVCPLTISPYVCCVCPWHSVNGGGSPFCQPCWQCPVLCSLFALCRTRLVGRYI
jgi:hypothetical protein